MGEAISWNALGVSKSTPKQTARVGLSIYPGNEWKVLTALFHQGTACRGALYRQL